MVGVPEEESTGLDEVISTQKTQTLAEKMGEEPGRHVPSVKTGK